MPVHRCATHPDAEAGFRCDGCGSLLCAACVEEGHRLLFCRLCRERALPLDERAPATVPERRRAAMRVRPYGWRDALRYPVRGKGGMVFWAYLALLLVLRVAGLVPGVGLAAAAFGLVVTFLVPGLIYAVARQTAAGNDELPDWPDLADGERVREAISFVGLVALIILPSAVLLRLADCHSLALLDVKSDAGCKLAFAAGLIPGLVLAVPTLGALAIYHGGALVLLRPDVHLRALYVAGADGLRTAAVLAVLVLAGGLLGHVLAAVPWLGSLLHTAVIAYTAFVGAHLVGLVFRRHGPELDAFYLG